MRRLMLEFVVVALMICVGAGAKEGDGERGPRACGQTAGEAHDSCTTESLQMRRLSKEITVAASLDDVWHCWTTSEGLASFFSSESKVELRVGGPYECYFGIKPDADGKRGTQGCKVLSFIPREMLSFEWNFPPNVPTLRSGGAKTHVVLRFLESHDGKVVIRLDQLGWGQGEDWDKGYAYFDRAWDMTLLSLKNLFEERNATIPCLNAARTPQEDE